MSIPIIAFFNNKGGVGKTSLVYHLAWMFSDLQVRVLAADLDPQANLTAAFVGDEDLLSSWWQNDTSGLTIYDCIRPLLQGTGDVAEPEAWPADDNLALLPGNLLLSMFEDELSSQWPEAMSGRQRAFRVLSAFWRIIQRAAANHQASLVLLDLGPNLGSINRACLISADYVVIPLSPDLFSLVGLRNLGSTFKNWRTEWKDRLDRKPAINVDLPAGRLQPLGYVVLQHSVRLDRPVKAYDQWMNRIPGLYRDHVLNEPTSDAVSIREDPHSLALLKHYRSLMSMAQEARKPMFHLKPADGAIGAHFQSAQEARKDFNALATAVAKRAGIPML
ncbi:MAG: ParA family protein [Bryobacteraceae bacterium]